MLWSTDASLLKSLFEDDTWQNIPEGNSFFILHYEKFTILFYEIPHKTHFTQTAKKSHRSKLVAFQI